MAHCTPVSGFQLELVVAKPLLEPQMPFRRVVWFQAMQSSYCQLVLLQRQVQGLAALPVPDTADGMPLEHFTASAVGILGRSASSPMPQAAQLLFWVEFGVAQ